MQTWINALCAALMISAAGVAFAQETNTEAQATDQPETEQSEGANELSMGTADGEAEAGGMVVKGVFTDWELRCITDRNQVEVCQLYQLLLDDKGNSVAEFNIFPLPEGQQAAAGANIITPLGTLLTANLRLAVDGGQGKRYPYSFCNAAGCFARIGFTNDELAQFRRGANAQVTIASARAPNQPVNLTLSLSGFTAGFNALVEIEAERAASE